MRLIGDVEGVLLSLTLNLTTETTFYVLLMAVEFQNKYNFE
jgi:hypothetical protein